jgi:hypothetical protein
VLASTTSSEESVAIGWRLLHSLLGYLYCVCQAIQCSSQAWRSLQGLDWTGRTGRDVFSPLKGEDAGLRGIYLSHFLITPEGIDTLPLFTPRLFDLFQRLPITLLLVVCYGDITLSLSLFAHQVDVSNLAQL